MLTLSLVFEDRNEHGRLTHYQRFDLSAPAAMHLCRAMVGDDEWFHWFHDLIDGEEMDFEVRCALLDFITTYDPDALKYPAS
jgi:hypothetical protein